jgi:ATP-binding cassette, subfamily B, bacterial
VRGEPRGRQSVSGWRAAARNARAAASLSWSAGPVLIAGLAIVSVAAGLIPPATAWLQREVLDALVTLRGSRTHHGLSSRDVIIVALALGAVGVAAAAIPQGQAYIEAVLQRVIRTAMYDRAYAAVASWPGITRFESPIFADKLQLTSQLAQNSVGSMLTSALGCVQALVTAVSFFATLIVLNLWLAVLITALESLAIAANLVNARRQAQLQVETSSRARRQMSFGRLLSNPVAAKEVRLFGLGDFLRGRMLTELDAINVAERALDRRLLWVESGLSVLSATAITGGLVWIVTRVAATGQPVGNVTLFIMAAMGMQGAMNQIASALGGIAQSITMFGAYDDVVSAPPDLPVAGTPRTLPALRQGITVEDVWFRYDESHPWVLRGVSLFIPAGAHVALVGLNGSGKSTLVKLLCRLYDPVRGSISWDGVDIRDFDPASLRQRITGVFQDFVSYELTAAENIGLGDVDKLGDPQAIRQAAVLAGADSDVSRLPQGYDTMLSRVFYPSSPKRGTRTGPPAALAAGVMLSGGQRQRIALARALMRADRDLLIVDEPTSYLDAESEHAVNRRLAEVRTDRTCVLISHRLSTVREADQIAVLSEGVVAERGTHADLITLGGHYERLYSLQAAGYSEPGIRETGVVNAEAAQ